MADVLMTVIVVYIFLHPKWLPYCLGHYTCNFSCVHNDGKTLSDYLSSPLMLSNIWIFGCMCVCPQKMHDITIFCSTFMCIYILLFWHILFFFTKYLFLISYFIINVFLHIIKGIYNTGLSLYKKWKAHTQVLPHNLNTLQISWSSGVCNV